MNLLVKSLKVGGIIFVVQGFVLPYVLKGENGKGFIPVPSGLPGLLVSAGATGLAVTLAMKALSRVTK